MSMTPNVDVGVSATITYAMLEAGLTGSGGMTHDIGFRGTVGARVKDVMPGLTIGMYAQTEQPHEYDNLHVTSMHGSEGLSLLQVLLKLSHLSNVMVLAVMFVDKMFV